jgi:long-chain acyl-CoA synthetase
MATKAVDVSMDIPYRTPKPGTDYTSDRPLMLERPGPDEDTLPKCFLKNTRQYADVVASRKKHMGIWQEYTWRDTYDQVSGLCLGLISLGLRAGDVVAIIGENDPEFYWAQMAAHAGHAMSCGVFSDASADDLAYVINKTQATFIIAHDQEQVDKALSIQPATPSVLKVVYWEERGLWSYDNAALMSLPDVQVLGRSYRETHPDLFETLIAETAPQDTIILSMTSGTTSMPKFARITNQQLIIGNRMNFEMVSTHVGENWLSFSPMAWMTEQAFGFAPHIIHGMTANFPESAETVAHDLREIAPVGLLFPSRVWENLASNVRFRINDSTWINRQMYALFLPVAYRIIDIEDHGDSVPLTYRLARWLGEFAIFQPLRDKLGLVKARNILTAGAMLSPDVLRFFRAIGVELRQLYASTETLGTIHAPGDVRLGSVGVLVPGVEIRIAEDQEILVRTEARFDGYYLDPDKTGEVIDTEGWYYTGDAGYIDADGHLHYLERLKEMISLANGHSFSPQYIEGRLKFSPFIQDIMTIGGPDRPYVAAIIIVDFENVARWAEKRGLGFTTMVDLSQKPEVYQIIGDAVAKVNEALPPLGQLRKFVILHKAFDADEGELTRTRKLRRGILAEKYAGIVDALYSDGDGVDVRAEVRYRDGRTSIVETRLSVHDMLTNRKQSGEV